MNYRRPLLNLSTEVDINVRDFGHDLTAIKAAFARAAKTSLPCRVVFEKRTYVLKGHAERHALTLAGLKNVVVEGGGARFEVEDPQKLFMRIHGAENIILRNFSVDYTRSPFTQGWIRKIDRSSSTIEVELADGFPDLDEKVFREAETKAMFVKDRANPLEYKKASEYRLYVDSWTRLGTRRFTMAIHNSGCRSTLRPAIRLCRPLAPMARRSAWGIADNSRCTPSPFMPPRQRPSPAAGTAK